MNTPNMSNVEGKRFELLLKKMVAKNLYMEASRDLLELDVLVDSATRFAQDQKIAEVCALQQGAAANGLSGSKMSNVSVDINFPDCR